MATNNNWNNAIAAANSAITLNSGTNAVSISSDASATTVNLATGAAVKTVSLGSTNSTSTTTVQSGSGALNVTSTNGALTINSGTGALSISNDASATTVNLATGAAAKTVTLGSTTTTSSLALKYGTSDFSLDSATGTVINALDTGEVTMPLQPAFLAALSATQSNVTGTAAAWININANTEVYDVNGDYNSGTFTFTAPVTGKYMFVISSVIIGCTIADQIGWQVVTSNRTYENQLFRNASADNLGITVTVIADMDSADTAQFLTLSGGEAGVTDDIYGDGTVGGTYCSGLLVV